MPAPPTWIAVSWRGHTEPFTQLAVCFAARVLRCGDRAATEMAVLIGSANRLCG